MKSPSQKYYEKNIEKLRQYQRDYYKRKCKEDPNFLKNKYLYHNEYYKKHKQKVDARKQYQKVYQLKYGCRYRRSYKKIDNLGKLEVKKGCFLISFN
jgi:TRAP-type C4-dicarboxylate transport system substrate-binding protein